MFDGYDQLGHNCVCYVMYVCSWQCNLRVKRLQLQMRRLLRGLVTIGVKTTNEINWERDGERTMTPVPSLTAHSFVTSQIALHFKMAFYLDIIIHYLEVEPLHRGII